MNNVSPTRVDQTSRTASSGSPEPGAPGWLRILLPAVLVVTWLVVAGIGGPYFGRVSEVSSNDQTAFLPESADATRVQHLLGELTGSDAVPAIAVFVADGALSRAQLDQIGQQVSGLTEIEGVEAPSPALPSEDGMAVQVFVPIDSGSDVAETAGAVAENLRANAPEGVAVHLTGPAGLSADLIGAFSGVDGLLLGVALMVVLVILLLVYRSVLLPVAVLATSMFALCAALLTIWWLARWGILLLSGQTQGILFILVIGAATDYSLLLVARYREELRVHRDAWNACRKALRGSIEPILASGGTVIAGLLTLTLSDLKSNSTLGPVTAIGIAFAMASALTLLPAILVLCGRTAFWPRRPRYAPESAAADRGAPSSGPWAGVSRLLGRRPRTVWAVTAVVLLVLALVAGGACAGAELYTRSRVVSVVHSALPGLAADARVSTQGLVLPQVLRGELDSLSVTASELDLASGDGTDGQDADAGPDGSDGSDGSAQDGLRLLDVEASLTSVGLSDTFPAGSVDATASVGWDQVTAMVAAAAPDAPAMAVQAGALGSDEDPGTISASTSVLGLSASLTIVPTVTDDGGLLLDVTSVTVRGTEFDTDAMIFGRPVLSYVGLDTHEIRVGAESLPQGLTLTRVAVTDKGLRLALSGTDVELANM